MGTVRAHDLGSEVRLIPPNYVKSFGKRQKNDAEDAAAIAEATLRPNLHYVAVKSAEHQAQAVAFRTQQSFVGQRTQLITAMRGHLAGRCARAHRSQDRRWHNRRRCDQTS